MQQDTTQLPSPALGAMDDLLARREKALALVRRLKFQQSLVNKFLRDFRLAKNLQAKRQLKNIVM